MPNASVSYGLIEGSAARGLDFLAGESIGVIGCGHLGSAIALQLVSGGFPIDRLRVSRGKSDGSLQKIIDAGLGPCLAGNEEICRDCSIIFICIRPQSLPELQPLTFSRNALVVSCLAGVSLPAIRRLLGADAVRMMPSGPDSILEGKGIAAIYPHNQALSQILQALGLRVFELAEEDQIHVFTAGICLPAALAASVVGEGGMEDACQSRSRDYPDFPKICSWARETVPRFEGEEDKRNYISRVATRGGVTEAMLESLRRNGDLKAAIKRGIERSREISRLYEEPK